MAVYALLFDGLDQAFNHPILLWAMGGMNFCCKPYSVYLSIADYEYLIGERLILNNGVGFEMLLFLH